MFTFGASCRSMSNRTATLDRISIYWWCNAAAATLCVSFNSDNTLTPSVSHNRTIECLPPMLLFTFACKCDSNSFTYFLHWNSFIRCVYVCTRCLLCGNKKATWWELICRSFNKNSLTAWHVEIFWKKMIINFISYQFAYIKCWIVDCSKLLISSFHGCGN